MTAKPTRAVKVESERIAYPRLAAIVEAILIEHWEAERKGEKGAA